MSIWNKAYEDFRGHYYKDIEEKKMSKEKHIKAAKAGKRWQDSDGDGKWYEKGDDVAEGSMKQARKNVGADTCWDGYKAKGTKKKGGKDVPNCVKEDDTIEEKKGLWDNIHAKRKRGEKPAKKGDKDYPKTLNIEGKMSDKDIKKRVDYTSDETRQKKLDKIKVKMVNKEETEVDEAMSSYDKNRKRAAQRAADRNAARAAGKTGVVPGVGYVTPNKERETYTDEKGTVRHKSGAKNEEVETEVEEGYKELSRDKRNKMFRKAGNLSRTALQGGDKGTEAGKKSGKIVKVLNKDAEKNNRNDVRKEHADWRAEMGIVFEEGSCGSSDDSKKPGKKKNKITINPEVRTEANAGPSTPVKYDKHMKIMAPNMGAGRPGKVRLKDDVEFAGNYQGPLYAPHPDLAEGGLQGAVDSITQKAQGALKKMGVKINKTPRSTATPSVQTQNTMRQNAEETEVSEDKKKKDDSYLETNMKKRQSNNEKARKDMEKVPGQKNPHFEDTILDKVVKCYVPEEDYDRMKDRRQERGGVDGNDRYKSATKNNTNKFGTGKTAMQKASEKKHGKGKSAMDIVRSEIEKKHGKGAIMDKKKK